MIRNAIPADIPVIHQMVQELADYHGIDETGTDEQLHGALFGPDPVVFALLAEDEGEPAGFALWYRSYSTWSGTHGIYLEDLFVRPQHRGAGHGKALLAALAAICVERGYGQFEWSVHHTNEPSIDFYRSLGARTEEVWTGFELSGAPLRKLAASQRVNPK
jgi:ribosomal protein S18 acetylase RimI-like enzyme